MTVMDVSTFQRLFRDAAGLEVDGSDLPRCNAVVTRTLYRMLLAAQATAATYHRYIIEPGDLPITQGLQENIDRFTMLAQRLDLERILAQLATYRPLDRIPATETTSRFPDIVGGLTMALARTLTLIDPQMTHPREAHWATLRSLVDLYL